MTLYWKDVNGRNWPVCTCLKEWLTAYQDELLRVGEIKHGLDLYQAIGNAPASAGYHKGGGNVDTAQTSKRAVTIARNMGGASWARGPADGMSVHCHTTLKGCPHMTAGPRWQVTELQAGRNGLANRGKDRGPRAGIKWPLRTYKEGITWAKAHLITESWSDMATEKEIVDAVWRAEIVPGPYETESFPDGMWAPSAVLSNTAAWARDARAAALATLALTKILVERGTDLTAAEIEAAVAAGINDVIDNATVTLEGK